MFTFVSASCGRHFLTCSCILKKAKEGSLAITFMLSDNFSVTEISNCLLKNQIYLFIYLDLYVAVTSRHLCNGRYKPNFKELARSPQLLYAHTVTVQVVPLYNCSWEKGVSEYYTYGG